MQKQTKKAKITDEEIRKLVVARLKSFPAGRKISIGSEGDFSKEELIAKVESDDDIGKKIIKVQLEFLRSLKQGNLLND